MNVYEDKSDINLYNAQRELTDKFSGNHDKFKYEFNKMKLDAMNGCSQRDMNSYDFDNHEHKKSMDTKANKVKADEENNSEAKSIKKRISKMDKKRKYKKIAESLQSKIDSGEITLEFAESVNDLAYNKYILESDDYSQVNTFHKQKEKMNLSDFKCESKKNEKTDGKPITLTWKDGNKKVCTVMFDTEPASDGYRYFGSFEVSKIYRGHDLSNQILDLITTKYKVGALAVEKDNAVAIRLYKKHGFRIGETGNRDESYYYMYLLKNKEKV